jgi:hypothetical protein
MEIVHGELRSYILTIRRRIFQLLIYLQQCNVIKRLIQRITKTEHKLIQ